MIRTRSKNNHLGASHINVTPLVDVMLVLLIIFMVSAPMMTVGIPVDLPKSGAASMSEDEKPMTLTIDKEGGFFLGENKVSEDEIRTQLQNEPNHERKVCIRGDQKLVYGDIIRLMSIVSECGFSKIALVASAKG